MVQVKTKNFTTLVDSQFPNCLVALYYFKPEFNFGL